MGSSAKDRIQHHLSLSLVRETTTVFNNSESRFSDVILRFIHHQQFEDYSFCEQLKLGVVVSTCDPKCLSIEIAWAQEDPVLTIKKILLPNGHNSGAFGRSSLCFNWLPHLHIPVYLPCQSRFIERHLHIKSCHAFSKQRLESKCISPWHRNATGILINDSQQGPRDKTDHICQLLLLSLLMIIIPSGCYNLHKFKFQKTEKDAVIWKDPVGWE